MVANRLASTKQKLLQAGSSSLDNTVKEKKETGTSSNKKIQRIKRYVGLRLKCTLGFTFPTLLSGRKANLLGSKNVGEVNPNVHFSLNPTYLFIL